MATNYSQKQLRASILSEKIQQKTLYYSLSKKQQKNLSFFTNQRLLLLDFQESKLYYSNQTKNLPFKTNIPPPKNQFAQIDSTLVRHLPNTPEIQFTFQFNKETVVWKFVFDSNQLADQWEKLIDFQRKSQQIKEKDLKSLNKAIFEMPKIEKQNADDIVKEPQRDIANDQSRLLSQMIGMSRIRPNQKNQGQVVRATPKSKAKSYSDWNLRFYKERNILTLFEFQRAATDSFFASYNKDRPKSQPIRTYQNQNFIVKIADKFTANAKTLKNQYRNYHFILDATNRQFIVGVPLSCIVQYEGVVGLVKARFPEKAEIISFDDVARNQIQTLERYTRIKNRIIESCKIMNLSKEYDSKNNKNYLIYLDNIQQYIPFNMEFPLEQTLVRPEYLLDSVDYLVFSGHPDKLSKVELRQVRQLGALTIEKAKQFSNNFFKDVFPISKISQLKNMLHESGLNLKVLPYIYNTCTNAHVKRHIYTAMTAKIVKDYVFENTIKIRQTDKQVPFKKLIEDTFTVLLEGNNNRSHQLWKQISLIFKKKYNIILNHKEILTGFFLNSILELIPGIYEIDKINKKKKIFEEIRIFQNGFVTETLPKVKCYQRFLPENIEAIKIQAKQYIKSKDICKKIIAELFNPKDNKYETYYSFGNNDEWMTDYLSLYYPPSNLANETEDKIDLLFDRINEEPPSYFTLNLTKNYLQWCNKKQNTQQFKSIFDKSMNIANYWLDQNHPMRSDLFQCLSDYYSILGMNQEMIKYMKESLNICIKFWGPSASQAGLKQYELADRFLRAGRKKEALDNFCKAKQNMELNKTKTNKLGLAYMKVASIYLSDLEYQKAVEFAQLSIKNFEDYQKRIKSSGIYNEPYKIKSFQILGRVYEICDRRSEYKDMALSCAKKFNQTRNQQVFQQMIRICVASAIFKSNNERCQSFLKLAKSTLDQSKDVSNLSYGAPIQELMKLSDDIIVMERFIYRYEHFERSLFELNIKKRQLTQESRQFLFILKNVIGVVSLDYIKGLVQEKISYGNN